VLTKETLDDAGPEYVQALRRPRFCSFFPNQILPAGMEIPEELLAGKAEDLPHPQPLRAAMEEEETRVGIIRGALKNRGTVSIFGLILEL